MNHLGKILIVGVLWLGLTIWLGLRVLSPGLCKPEYSYHVAKQTDNDYISYSVASYENMIVLQAMTLFEGSETTVTCLRGEQAITCRRSVQP